MRHTVARVAAVGLVASALGGGVIATTATADEHWEPELVEGNATCEELGYESLLKVEEPESYNQDGWVTEVSEDDLFLDVLDTPDDVMVAYVIVKGGPNSYVYDVSEEPLPWLNLRAPDNEGGQQSAISHYEFCGVPALEFPVEKLDANTEAPLAGAEFDLVWDDDMNGYDEDDPVLGSCTTDESGTCTVTVPANDVTLNATYFWVETAAPPGYALPDPAVQGPIVLENGEVVEGDMPTVFLDEHALTDLSVMKLDAATHEPLAGAAFVLFADDDGEEGPSEGDTVAGSCETDDTGSCTVTGLDWGTYYWFEESAPEGYFLPDDRYSDLITINAENAGSEIEAFTFHDVARTSLTVEKLDEANDEPLAGAFFDLVMDDGDEVYGDGDVFHASCETGGDGTCTIDDVPPGTYFWVETQAPTGYMLPDNPVSDPVVVTVESAGGEHSVVTFHDPRILTELGVKKVAEDTEEVLAGGVFELYLDDGDGVSAEPDEGDVLIGECTTDDTGVCGIDGLDFGDYYWYETEAPDGYLLPDDRTSTVITINAENAGTTMIFTFVDPPVPPETPPTTPPGQPDDDEDEDKGGKLPDTGAGAAGIMAAIAAGLTALGGGLLLVRRRFGLNG